jgi:hypothetical protein
MTRASPSVSHDRLEETSEAKARWFQSLTLDERMTLLCEYTDLALSRNPELGIDRQAQSIAGRVRVLELP